MWEDDIYIPIRCNRVIRSLESIPGSRTVVEIGGSSMQVSRKLASRVVVSVVGVMAFISITSLHTTLKDAKVKDSKLAELQEVVAEKDSELEIKSEEIAVLENRVSLLQAQMVELEEELSVVWNASSEEIPEWEIDIFELTGYAPFDDPVGLCSDGNPESTATGTRPTEGRTIAVDPKVIPLGSRVWIEGLGWRIAEDTGGAIRGNKIDVMYASRGDALRNNREAIVVYKKEVDEDE